jgi:tetratricopeptide (TPR) repeat protein
MAYEAEGRIDLAIQHMEKAISIYNLEPDDHYHLGEQYARKRQFEKAILSLGAAYELAHGKTKVQAAFRIGQCRMELGHPAEAVRAFRAVLELNPNHVLALNNLAYLEATSQPPVRDVDSAVGHVERALKLAPNALFVVDTAVDVCSAKGDRRRAVELLRGTLKLAASNDPLRPRLEQRLAELTGAPPTTTRP